MKVENFELKLKEHNMRITKSRRIIFDLLLKSKSSLTVKEVFELTSADKNLKTDLASVYRNLDILTEVGLLHKLQDGRYKVCDHDESDHNHNHIHVLFNCTSCSKAEEVSSHSKELCSLANKLKGQTKLLSEASEILVRGLCKNCS